MGKYEDRVWLDGPRPEMSPGGWSVVIARNGNLSLWGPTTAQQKCPATKSCPGGTTGFPKPGISNPCSGHGTCDSATGTCNCDKNYVGANCSFQLCQKEADAISEYDPNECVLDQ